MLFEIGWLGGWRGEAELYYPKFFLTVVFECYGNRVSSGSLKMFQYNELQDTAMSTNNILNFLRRFFLTRGDSDFQGLILLALLACAKSR